MMRYLSLTVGLLAIAALTAISADALTIEQFHRSSATAGDVTLSYSAADSDRAVIVAWGASDAGASFTSWVNRSYAEGVASADSTSCRVTLPPVYYLGFDAIVLEPIRPLDGTFLFLR